VSRESIGKLMMGRIQDSKLGGALKKIAPSGGRRENFGGISNLVKWTLTEMECSVAGTTTLDRE
jgi:hypothetical protein